MNVFPPSARWALLAALGLFSAAAHAVDLVTAYEAALQHDPAKLAADQARVAGRELAVQGDALLRPQISLQAGVSRIHDRSSGNIPPALASYLSSSATGTVRQAGVVLTQPLYDAKASAQKQQLHLQSDLAETQFEQSRQDLVQRVSEAYFGVLLAQDALRVAQAEKAALGLQRDRAQARFDVGRGKITDLREAQARYDQVVTKEISARSTLDLRRAGFRETTGLPADGLAGLAADFVPSAPVPSGLEAWQQRGEEHSTLVLAKRSQLEIATAEIGKYRLAGRPTLNLVASYTGTGQSGNLSPLQGMDGRSTGSVGLQFSMPLYAGGGIDSRERESIAKQGQAEQDLATARRDVRLRVQDAFLAVTTGVSRVASLTESLQSARTALEATTLGRDVGTRTAPDVLDAQQRVFEAELALAQARFDYLLGRVRLSAAAGELELSDVRNLNGLLASH
jgi:outer membrane protein